MCANANANVRACVRAQAEWHRREAKREEAMAGAQREVAQLERKMKEALFAIEKKVLARAAGRQCLHAACLLTAFCVRCPAGGSWFLRFWVRMGLLTDYLLTQIDQLSTLQTNKRTNQQTSKQTN